VSIGGVSSQKGITVSVSEVAAPSVTHRWRGGPPYRRGAKREYLDEVPSAASLFHVDPLGAAGLSCG